MDAVCPMCKTTKYRNPSMKLMVNVCGHALCESCVELLFAKGSGSCQECRIPLRRTDFRLQLFEDATIDKEVDIRRRILRDFNKAEDEFDCLRSYNDYLEMVEDIIYNLCNNIEILETNKKIAEYKEVNKTQIAKNKHKTKTELLELEDILAEEKSVADKAKSELEEAEKTAKLRKVQNKEKLIDDLMFSDVDAGAIIKDHESKISETDGNFAKCATGAEVAAASRAGIGNSQKQMPFNGTNTISEEKPFIYEPLNTYYEGPNPPSWEEIRTDGYYKYIRPAEQGEKAAGYVENIACWRALQEAMCGLYFEHSLVAQTDTQ